jgi:hypothetical protein
MRRSESSPSESTPASEQLRGRLLMASPLIYTLLVIAAVVAASGYSLRAQGIFGCQASGYGNDRYMGYCNTTHYGDYDHGAFWFGLEPAAIDAAIHAQVLFLGNSRMQFGLSTQATDDWFAALPSRYYLLGFSHNANFTFEQPLLRKLQPRATVYVINVDLFFEPTETPPARQVMHDGNANGRYEQKRTWQHLHKALCSTLRFVCGDNIAFFRSLTNGNWTVTGRGFRSRPVSYDHAVDQKIVAAYTQSAEAFMSYLSLPRNCTILTIIPTVNTSIGTARAIAAAMNMDLIAPELPGLGTFDESHLDRESAQRWSAAFMEAAGPRIRSCLPAESWPRAQLQSR